MAKPIDTPDLDQALVCIDKGFIELHEYLKMRMEAEAYLNSHPNAQRILNTLRYLGVNNQMTSAQGWTSDVNII